MNKNIFEYESCWKAIAALAIPTMLGQLGTIVYNFADTYFISQINDVNQVAAISLTMPIFLILMSLGALFGIGGAAYISRMLGSDHLHEVKITSSYVFYITFLSGIIITFIGSSCLNQITYMIGSEASSFLHVKNYLLWIFIGSIFILLSNSMAFVIRGVGCAKEAMIGLIMGTILNIVLDPLLILTFHMGIQGAAIATVIANLVTVVYYCFCYHKSEILSLTPNTESFKWKFQQKILSIGIPGACVTILLSVSTIIMNNFLHLYGTESIAAMGIVSKINLFPIQLAVGLGQGVQPLLGYYIGNGNDIKLKSTIKNANICSVIMGIIFLLLFILYKEELLYLFLQDEKVIQCGSQFLIYVSLSTPLLGTIFIFSGYFQCKGLPKQALLISIARQGAFYIPIIIIGNLILYEKGVVLSQPLSDILSFFLCIFLYQKSINKCNSQQT